MTPIEIIVHCSATRPEWWQGKSLAAKVNEIRRWHVEDNGWRDIGYHFLIDRDGKVAAGRPMSQQGAHTKGHNANSIGVCLFGGFGSNAGDEFEEHFTVEQDTALRNLIQDIQDQFGPRVTVSGHNQYANKACPGFNVPDWLPQPIKTPNPATGTGNTGLAAIINQIIAAIAAFIRGLSK